MAVVMGIFGVGKSALLHILACINRHDSTVAEEMVL